MYKNQFLPLFIVLFYIILIIFFFPTSTKGKKRKRNNEKYVLPPSPQPHNMHYGSNEASKVSDQILSQWMEYIKKKQDDDNNRLLKNVDDYDDDNNNNNNNNNINNSSSSSSNNDYKKQLFRLLSMDTLSGFLPSVYGYLKYGYYTIFDINEWKQNNQESLIYDDQDYLFRDDGNNNNNNTNHSVFEGIWAIISLITFIIFLLICIYFCGIYGTANFFCFSIRAAKFIATSFSILSFFLVITKWYHFYNVTF
jgi:hypothetical protein